ncbi:MAG: hypothetical protein COZ69_07525 [Deltaproteobacteria bacterium CG_4_8_14_3_um_filter_45_9]|jgi:hypothetical protein|nr:MAG: hypothetical protein COS40_10695 [Deltaproteobacteria bacterium CG03_land_8_20_14_0_80_45_14]PIX23879.1 MAG: hypothetical protein COZ69_07525 [Deltaproteobacteria bacterium CG_4_8_14_3_um_filter_45_9]
MSPNPKSLSKEVCEIEIKLSTILIQELWPNTGILDLSDYDCCLIVHRMLPVDSFALFWSRRSKIPLTLNSFKINMV